MKAWHYAKHYARLMRQLFSPNQYNPRLTEDAAKRVVAFSMDYLHDMEKQRRDHDVRKITEMIKRAMNLSSDSISVVGGGNLARECDKTVEAGIVRAMTTGVSNGLLKLDILGAPYPFPKEFFDSASLDSVQQMFGRAREVGMISNMLISAIFTEKLASAGWGGKVKMLVTTRLELFVIDPTAEEIRHAGEFLPINGPVGAAE